jgi:hypothetical protein
VQTEPAEVQTEPADKKTWYTFTIPVSSNYVAAAFIVILESAMFLAFGAMFMGLESRQISNLMRNGANVRIQGCEIPLVGGGLLARKGCTWRAALRFLVFFAICTAGFSASGRTATLSVNQEALLVGGDVTIFDTLGEQNRTFESSWPFTFDTINSNEPIMTHFSADYTNGPTSVLNEAEATCSYYSAWEV